MRTHAEKAAGVIPGARCIVKIHNEEEKNMKNEKMEMLKKTKAENILDMEDLEKTAGGTPGELADDTRFLNVLLRGRQGQPGRYNAVKCFFSGDVAREIQTAWKSVGIDIWQADVGGNSYSLNGKEITRDEAWAHAEKVVGKHLEKKDWDW